MSLARTPSRFPKGRERAMKSTRTTTTIVRRHFGARSDIRERVAGLFSSTFSTVALSRSPIRRSTFSDLLSPGGRVPNYPGRTSSDYPAVIACQLFAFDVIKLILGGETRRRAVRRADQGSVVVRFFFICQEFPMGICAPSAPRPRRQSRASLRKAG